MPVGSNTSGRQVDNRTEPTVSGQTLGNGLQAVKGILPSYLNLNACFLTYQ